MMFADVLYDGAEIARGARAAGVAVHVSGWEPAGDPLPRVRWRG